jgi:mannose-6-phosphate isomerase-like protein (cupin superfamily)
MPILERPRLHQNLFPTLLANTVGGAFEKEGSIMLTTEYLPPPANSKERIARQKDMAANSAPTLFQVKGPLLAEGRTTTTLAATNDLTIQLKIYASEGENELHAHPGEDHSFIVLQGTVLFYDQDGEMGNLGPNEGIMLPRGCFYWFHATSDEPLVMIRVGTPEAAKLDQPNRININGNPMHGGSEENKSVPVKYLEGQFFG